VVRGAVWWLALAGFQLPSPEDRDARPGTIWVTTATASDTYRPMVTMPCAVATRREGHRQPRSGREVPHLRWGQVRTQDRPL
jgi:hypothetical protein